MNNILLNEDERTLITEALEFYKMELAKSLLDTNLDKLYKRRMRMVMPQLLEKVACLDEVASYEEY